MKPEHLEDQLEQLNAESSKAIEDAVVLVHCKTGLPAEFILVALLGGIAGKTARALGPEETAKRCANLADQLQIMAQPDLAEIAMAMPLGRA